MSYFTDKTIASLLDNIGKTIWKATTNDPTTSDKPNIVGSLWINTLSSKIFVYKGADASGNAIWSQVTASQLPTPIVNSSDVPNSSSGSHTISNYDPSCFYFVSSNSNSIRHISISGSNISITTGDINSSSEPCSYVLGVYKDGYIPSFVTVNFNVFIPTIYDQQVLISESSYVESSFDEIYDGSIV